MKKLIAGILMGLLVSFTAGQAAAITIGFDPNPVGPVTLGSPVEVVLTISGLGDHTAPSLGVFDLDVGFDPAILAFSSADYGDPVLGDQLDLAFFGSVTLTTHGVVSVNLCELSIDSTDDLNNLQEQAFTLAKLIFATIGTGTSQLGLFVYELGDAAGDPLTADLLDGSVTVNSPSDPPVGVPEPASLLLLLGGLLSIGIARKSINAAS